MGQKQKQPFKERFVLFFFDSAETKVRATVRWSMTSLVVLFNVFLHLLHRGIAGDESCFAMDISIKNFITASFSYTVPDIDERLTNHN